MPSITTEYNGRLCNQIIRNLCVSFIAKKHNLLVHYSNFDKIVSLGIELFVGKNDYNDTIQLIDENYFEILNKEFLFNNIDPNTRHFQIKEIMDMIYLYLQSNDVKNNIIKYNLFKDKYNNNNDCSIHIRLTDAENNNPGIEYYLHLFSFQTPILLGKKNKNKCKINSRNFTYDSLTFSSCLFLLEDVKDEI